MKKLSELPRVVDWGGHAPTLEEIDGALVRLGRPAAIFVSPRLFVHITRESEPSERTAPRCEVEVDHELEGFVMVRKP